MIGYGDSLIVIVWLGHTVGILTNGVHHIDGRHLDTIDGDTIQTMVGITIMVGVMGIIIIHHIEIVG
tara:strand:- start:538 stop:738 length:201 start_codon:yes stop_codon:yes gene_type:complete